MSLIAHMFCAFLFLQFTSELGSHLINENLFTGAMDGQVLQPFHRMMTDFHDLFQGIASKAAIIL